MSWNIVQMSQLKNTIKWDKSQNLLQSEEKQWSHEDGGISINIQMTILVCLLVWNGPLLITTARHVDFGPRCILYQIYLGQESHIQRTCAFDELSKTESEKKWKIICPFLKKKITFSKTTWPIELKYLA